MPKLTYNCPVCDKQLKLDKEYLICDTKLYEYKCGHVFSKCLEKTDRNNLLFDAASDPTKVAREYQKDGIQTILESDFNLVLGDQMRLGKTPQALLALRNKYAERTPCLILVKGANLWQWIREYKIWTDPLLDGIYPIIGGSAWIPPGFKTYICSMDTFSLNPKCKCGHSFHEEKCTHRKSKDAEPCTCKVYQPSAESVRDKLKKLPIKLVIADEAHSFKNTESNRSQALVDFIAFMNTGEQNLELNFHCSRCDNKWIETGTQSFDKRIGHKIVSKQAQCPKCKNWCYMQQQHSERDDAPKDKPCGLVLLTGTPILNRAEEYFVPLNLVAPEKFSSLEQFRRTWLEQDHKGRYSRVKSYLLDSFKREIAPYVLRREKEDVYTDLPVINKIFTLIEPDKSALANQYNKILDKLEIKLAEKANPTYWDMAEDMMELRRICGMMKLMWVADYLEACQMDSATAKYAIGIHHKTVRDVLFMKLGGDDTCYRLSGEDLPERKDWIMRNWEFDTKRQFLIINMLAGGVGMDFHYCNNVLVLERQWNSEVESQFEFRFYNPDKSIKQDSTNIEYILAKGTLDEWWYDMVEAKRRNVGETVYNNWNLQSDGGSFKELMEKTVASRL